MERVYRDLGHIPKIFPKLLICDATIDFVVYLFVGGGVGGFLFAFLQ